MRIILTFVAKDTFIPGATVDVSDYLVEEELSITKQIENDNYELECSFADLSLVKSAELDNVFSLANLDKYFFCIDIYLSDSTVPTYSGMLENDQIIGCYNDETYSLTVKSHTKFLIERMQEDLPRTTGIIIDYTDESSSVYSLLDLLNLLMAKYASFYKTSNLLSQIGSIDVVLRALLSVLGERKSMYLGADGKFYQISDDVYKGVTLKNIYDDGYIPFEAYYEAQRNLLTPGEAAAPYVAYLTNYNVSLLAPDFRPRQFFYDPKAEIFCTVVNEFCKAYGCLFHIDNARNLNFIPRDTASVAKEIARDIVDEDYTITPLYRPTVEAVLYHKFEYYKSGRNSYERDRVVKVWCGGGLPMYEETQFPENEGVTLTDYMGGRASSHEPVEMKLLNNLDKQKYLTLVFNNNEEGLFGFKPEPKPEEVYSRYKNLLRTTQLLKCRIARTDIDLFDTVSVNGEQFNVTSVKIDTLAEESDIEAVLITNGIKPFD